MILCRRLVRNEDAPLMKIWNYEDAGANKFTEWRMKSEEWRTADRVINANNFATIFASASDILLDAKRHALTHVAEAVAFRYEDVTLPFMKIWRRKQTWLLRM